LNSKAKECARNRNAPLKPHRGWCEGFMKTEILSLWRRTERSQKLPSEFENKLIKFQRSGIGIRRRNKNSLSQIGNEDGTAVCSTFFAIMP
jgi:hypothetical protein